MNLNWPGILVQVSWNMFSTCSNNGSQFENLQLVFKYEGIWKVVFICNAENSSLL